MDIRSKLASLLHRAANLLNPPVPQSPYYCGANLPQLIYEALKEGATNGDIRLRILAAVASGKFDDKIEHLLALETKYAAGTDEREFVILSSWWLLGSIGVPTGIKGKAYQDCVEH